MPSSLELYYQKKAEKKAISPFLKRNIAKEFTGVPDIVKKQSPGLFVKLLDILDRSGNATRALLVGKLGGLKGLIPYAQFLEDLTGLDIAMDEEDLVKGTEVIEKFFGKQKQVKGKIDLVDVLGFLVEVVADPLWLVGGAGLTKLGKAKQLVRGAAKGALVDPKKYNVIKAAIAAAKTGTPMPTEVSKHLGKAFGRVYKEGGRAAMAKTWATQAARGERAVLKLGLPGYRVPVIKGVKAFETASKIAQKFKLGPLGKMFLAPTRRVSERYSDLHDIAIHYSRDLPAREGDLLIGKLHKMGKDIGKIGDLDDINAKLGDFIEKDLAGAQIEKYIGKIKARRAKKLAPTISKAEKGVEKLQKQIVARIERIESAVPKEIPLPFKKRVPLKSELDVVPKVKTFKDYTAPPKTKPLQVITPDDYVSKDMDIILGHDYKYKELKDTRLHRTAQAYEDRIAKMRNRLAKTEREGGRKAKKKIRQLTRRIGSLEKEKYISQFSRYNRAQQIKYDKAIAREASRTGRARAKIKGEVGVLEREKGKLQGKIGAYKRMGMGFKRGGTEEVQRIVDARSLGVKRAAEAKKVLGTVPEAGRAKFKEFAGKISGMNVASLAAEKAAKVPTSEIDNLLGYMRRLVTPEARQWLADKNMSERFLRQGKALSVRGGMQKRRSKLLGQLTKDEVDELVKGLGFEGEFFERGALASAAVRGAESTRTVGAADTITKSIEKFSKSDSWLAATGKNIDDYIPLQEFMKDTGLKIKAGQYAGKSIPREIAKPLLDMQELTSSSDAMRGFWNTYTQTQRYLKGMFTMPFPAYHSRNAISNVFLNWIGGVKNPMSYMKAAQMQKAVLKTRQIMRKQGILWDEAVLQTKQMFPTIKTATKEVPGWQLWDIADQHGVVGRSLGEMGTEEVIGGAARMGPKAKTRIGRHFKGEGRIWQWGRNVSGTVEDNARLAHFIEKTEKGLDPISASREMKKVLFDYGDLSAFEKKWMRDRVAFFYCVPTDCEILTHDGWKTHKQLKIGEKALGYDVDSGKCKWTDVQDIAVFDYDGVLMILKKNQSNSEWLFTPNHRWPVRQTVNRFKSRRKVVRGYELRSNHAIPYSAPFSDWPTQSLYTPREAAIIGWLLTDGTMSGPRGHNWRIYQSPKKYANEIRELLSNDALKESVHPDTGVISFGINAELRKNIQGRGFNSKKDGAWIVSKLSLEAAQAMWDAMYKADGVTVKHRKQDQFACMNDDVFDAAQILVQLFGKHMHRSQKGGYISQKQGQWCKVDNLGTEWYKGKVWCPQTGTGTWVMRCNGKVIITGNTFARKNLPLQIETLVKQPAKQAVFSHLAGGTPQMQTKAKDYPDYWQERLVVPLPYKTKEGKGLMAPGTGMPIEEAFGPLGGPGYGWIEQGRRRLSRMASRLSPIPLAGIEAATGHQMYFDKPIKDWGQWLSQKLPTGRMTGTAQYIKEGKGTPVSKASRLTTGLGWREYEPEKQKEYKLKQIMRDYLASQPETREFKRYYVPKNKSTTEEIDRALRLQ